MRGFKTGDIHPSAILGEGVVLGENVTIGANALIYDHVRIGDGSIIGPNSIIGEPTAEYYQDPEYSNQELIIGPNSLIRSGAIVYAGSVIGSGFECGHRVTIREHSKIGNHCRVGTLSDIQGDCEFGDYVRLHSNVHIGQKTTIGNYVWIFPYCVFTNDPHPPSNHLLGVTVEDFAVVTTMVVVFPGVTIGKDALVGAASFVRHDVPPETVVVGSPAKVVAKVGEIRSKTGFLDGESLYPWRNHFQRGMPWEGIGFDSWFESQ